MASVINYFCKMIKKKTIKTNLRRIHILSKSIETNIKKFRWIRNLSDPNFYMKELYFFRTYYFPYYNFVTDLNGPFYNKRYCICVSEQNPYDNPNVDYYVCTSYALHFNTRNIIVADIDKVMKGHVVIDKLEPGGMDEMKGYDQLLNIKSKMTHKRLFDFYMKKGSLKIKRNLFTQDKGYITIDVLKGDKNTSELSPIMDKGIEIIKKEIEQLMKEIKLYLLHNFDIKYPNKDISIIICQYITLSLT